VLKLRTGGPRGPHQSLGPQASLSDSPYGHVRLNKQTIKHLNFIQIHETHTIGSTVRSKSIWNQFDWIPISRSTQLRILHCRAMPPWGGTLTICLLCQRYHSHSLIGSFRKAPAWKAPNITYEYGNGTNCCKCQAQVRTQTAMSDHRLE
jgi:hypothetical protein